MAQRDRAGIKAYIDWACNDGSVGSSIFWSYFTEWGWFSRTVKTSGTYYIQDAAGVGIGTNG